MKYAPYLAAALVAIVSAPALSLEYGDDWGIEVESFALGVFSARTAGEAPPGPEGRTFLLAEERLRLDLTIWTDAAEVRVKLDGLHDAVTGEADIDLREAFLDYSTGDLDFRLGRQITTWGVGDLLFINDVFPKNWVSFFSGRPLEYLKLGVDGLRARYSSSIVNTEMLVIPRFEPDTLPTPARFFLHDDFRAVAVRARVLPDTGLQNPEVAIRLYRGIAGFDVSAYFYRGFWRAPGQRPDDPDSPTLVTQIFPPLSVNGLSAQGQAWGGVVSLEAGYYDSRGDRGGTDPAIANSQALFLAGYEKQLYEDFTVGIQYFAEIMMDFAAYKRALPAGFAQKRKYRDIVTLRLTRFLKYQTWQLSLFVFYSPAEHDYLFRPRVTYRVSDNLTVAMGANLFGGKKTTTFLGQFGRDDNAYLTLRYDF